LICCFLLSQKQHAQDQTVGVFLNTPEAVNGYTLFSPVASNQTYLIDNCGEKIKEWNFNTIPGMMAYLLEDGRLLRAGRLFNGFGAGGSGGLIELRSWDDELLWSYSYSDQNVKQHHDIEYLDNGNILIIAWERKTQSECIAAGRDPNFLTDAGLWFEHILELKPIGVDDAEIIWEWHLFDHMVQDFNPSLNNYVEDISQYPGRLDINYNAFFNGGPNLNSPDIFHFNAVDYNPELDLIMISCRNTSEVYIIDHSTSIEEANGSEGGRFGKGGDFLFRWGNDIIMNPESMQEQQLFSQHDASFVFQDDLYTGQISIFNNGLGRDEENTSSVEIIIPKMNSDSFSYSSDQGYILENRFSVFPRAEYEFSSARISGVQLLNNGNIFIASGNEGAVFELDQNGELLWKYINPIGQIGPVPQGQAPIQNDIFRALKYELDYKAFEERDLESQGVLELDPVDYGCEIYDMTDSSEDINFPGNILYPNPVQDVLYLESKNSITPNDYQVYNSVGQIIINGRFNGSLNVYDLNPGLYYLKIKLGTLHQVYKFVKL